MASDCKVKDSVSLKREIRALLISTKHGCTPKQLQDDYLQVMGENVPYHFMGYTNFMNFIYSIPDVVSVCRSRNNTILYGVADKSTKKIKDLVSKQKDSHSGYSSSVPRMNQVTKNIQPSPREPEVPPLFQTQLKELMLSHPNGIALKFFNEAFAKRFHHYIAFRNWGFDSVESMISSIPQILVIHCDTTRNIRMVKRVTTTQAKSSEEPERVRMHPINWYSLEHERQNPFSHEDKRGGGGGGGGQGSDARHTASRFK